MSSLYILLATILLIGSSLADPSVHSDTQAQSATKAEDGTQGRKCVGSCGSSSSSAYHHPHTGSHVDHGTTTSYGTGSYDLSGLGLGGLVNSAAGGLGYGVFALPILAVNIAILVLLGILLAHVKAIGYGETGTGDVYHYGAAVPAYVGGASAGVSSYQGYDSGASGGYHKRSTEEARSMQSPSMLSYLTKMVANAINEYAEIDKEEE